MGLILMRTPSRNIKLRMRSRPTEIGAKPDPLVLNKLEQTNLESIVEYIEPISQWTTHKTQINTVRNLMQSGT